MKLTETIQAIYRADECGAPAAVFDFIPEYSIWQHARAIFDDPEQGGLVGPTLLRAICEALDVIRDRASATDTVLYALKPSFDSLVYNAAQKTVLSHALEWSSDTAKQFYSVFEHDYLKTAVGDGDQFVASLALEGAVMLPIYRADERLLYSAIGLLLNEFHSR
jgi:hypothetical protein